MMTRKKGFIDAGLFEKIIGELKPYLLNMNLYFQGEPMLHPRFFYFLKQSAGIHTTVSTNGHFIDRESAVKILKSGLGRLIISLDGMDSLTYSTYRKNGSFEKVISGLEYLSESRKNISSSPKVEIQFLVNRFNEGQISEAKKLGKKLGFPVRLKSMQVISGDGHKFWLPSSKVFSRYESRNGGYFIKNKFQNLCSRLWFNPVVTWDGKVVPCCFDKDSDHIMGDLNEDSFRDIWAGPRYRLFRRELLDDRKSIDICGNCSSGLRGVSI
jgi:radical SAM protein with 4Fe4S-binding SPASM domain